jgi:hypothetical protein
VTAADLGHFAARQVPAARLLSSAEAYTWSIQSAWQEAFPPPIYFPPFRLRLSQNQSAAGCSVAFDWPVPVLRSEACFCNLLPAGPDILMLSPLAWEAVSRSADCTGWRGRDDSVKEAGRREAALEQLTAVSEENVAIELFLSPTADAHKPPPHLLCR